MAKNKVVKEEANDRIDEVEDVVADEKENTVVGKKAKVRFPGPWKKVSEEELKKAQKNGTLFGYDPKTGEAIINEEE